MFKEADLACKVLKVECKVSQKKGIINGFSIQRLLENGFEHIKCFEAAQVYFKVVVYAPDIG